MHSGGSLRWPGSRRVDSSWLSSPGGSSAGAIPAAVPASRWLLRITQRQLSGSGWISESWKQLRQSTSCNVGMSDNVHVCTEDKYRRWFDVNFCSTVQSIQCEPVINFYDALSVDVSVCMCVSADRPSAVALFISFTR